MDSLVFLLKSKLDTLPPSEKKVAEYIITDKKNVIYQGVNELAKATGASPSAVMRLCRSLGIPGFKEFKIMLARDVFSSASKSKTRKDPLAQAAIISQEFKIIDSYIDTLTDLKTTIDKKTIEKTVNLIEKSKYIYSFGVGLSNSVAFDFYHKMGRLGYLCGFAQDYYMQLIAASNMSPGMTAMFISHSGTTPEMVKAAKIAKNNGATLITITSNPEGDIAELSDIVLLVPFSEPLQRYGASSTRIAQLTIIDMIFSELIRKHPSRSIENLEKTSF